VEIDVASNISANLPNIEFSLSLTIFYAEGKCGRRLRIAGEYWDCLSCCSKKLHVDLRGNQMLPECPSCLAQINEQLYNRLAVESRQKWPCLQN
jgi:hypothetical protein